MRALKILSLCLTTLALVSASSCNRHTTRVSIDKSVNVTNCQPDQDPVEVAIDDTVKWNFGPSIHTYAVHFKKRTPFSTPDPPVGEKNKVKGDFWCSVSSGWCYYEYVITKDGGKLCGDPGVHVGPGG